MSLPPIMPTPPLSEKEWDAFMLKVEKGLKCPSYPVPTPRLWRAKELILEYAKKERK